MAAWRVTEKQLLDKAYETGAAVEREQGDDGVERLFLKVGRQTWVAESGTEE
jgi:hypothetical protein